jgi:hypothetical protein
LAVPSPSRERARVRGNSHFKALPEEPQGEGTASDSPLVCWSNIGFDDCGTQAGVGFSLSSGEVEERGGASHFL